MKPYLSKTKRTFYGNEWFGKISNLTSPNKTCPFELLFTITIQNQCVY